MQRKRELDPSVFNAATFAVVQRLIPPERLHGYLRNLQQEYRALVYSNLDQVSLENEAHKIVSQAGMLGLARMEMLAHALENACRTGAGSAAALQECLAAVEDVELYAMPALIEAKSSR